MDFRTAEGATFDGEDPNGHLRFRVEMPLDDEGYLGRQCPSCDQVFRIQAVDYEALPDDQVLTCPYCGHIADHGEFITDQQQERLNRVAMDAGMQMVSDMLGDLFRDMERSTRSSFVRVTYRAEPFYPEPLPGINEERLIRERQCPRCSMRYAVFGEHRYCPVCGPLLPGQVADDALAAETAKLDALDDIPNDQRAALREGGVFDRLYVDTLARVVGVVETLAAAAFRAALPRAEEVLKGRGSIFQRLDDMAELFHVNLAVDLRSAPGVHWQRLIELWAARHVHLHNGGTVDERYLKAAPNSPLKVGQRVLVTEADARDAIEQSKALCNALGALGEPADETRLD